MVDLKKIGELLFDYLYVKGDIKFRYVPLLSTGFNLVDLYIKIASDCMYADRSQRHHLDSECLKSRFLTHITGKSYEETLWGLVPIIGNLYLYVRRNYFLEKTLCGYAPALSVQFHDFDPYGDLRNDETKMRPLVKKNPQLINYIDEKLCKKFLKEDSILIQQIDKEKIESLVKSDPDLFNHLNIESIMKKYENHGRYSLFYVEYEKFFVYLDETKIKTIFDFDKKAFAYIPSAQTKSLELIYNYINNTNYKNDCLKELVEKKEVIEYLLSKKPALIFNIPKDCKGMVFREIDNIDVVLKIGECDQSNLGEMLSWLDNKKIKALLQIKPTWINYLTSKDQKKFLKKDNSLISHMTDSNQIIDHIKADPTFFTCLSPEQQQNRHLLSELLQHECKFPLAPSLKEDPSFISLVAGNPESDWDGIGFMFGSDLPIMVKEVLCTHSERKNILKKFKGTNIQKMLIEYKLAIPKNSFQWKEKWNNRLNEEKVRHEIFEQFDKDSCLALYFCWRNPTRFHQLIKLDPRFFKFAWQSYEMVLRNDKKDSKYPFIPSKIVLEGFLKQIFQANDISKLFTEEQLKDEAIIKKIAVIYPSIMKHMRVDFRKDEKLIQEIIQESNSYEILKFIDEDLRNGTFCQKLLNSKENGLNLKGYLFVGEKNLNNTFLIEQVKELCKSDIALLEHAGPEFLAIIDEKWVTEYLKTDKATLKIFRYLPQNLRENYKTILKKTIFENYSCMLFSRCCNWQKEENSDIDIDEKFIFSIIKEKPPYLRLLPDKCLYNKSLMKLFEEESNILSYIFEFKIKKFMGALLQDLSWFEKVIRKDPRFFEVLFDEDLRESTAFTSDPSLIRLARKLLDEDEDLFKDLSKDKLEDKIFIKYVYDMECPEILKYVPNKIKSDENFIGYFQIISDVIVLKYLDVEKRNDYKFVFDCDKENLQGFLYAEEGALKQLSDEQWEKIRRQYNKNRQLPKNVSKAFLKMFLEKYPETLEWNDNRQGVAYLRWINNDRNLKKQKKIPKNILYKIYAQQYVTADIADAWVISDKRITK